MAEMEMRAGGCLCGAVRFSARPLTHEVDACHCGKCRKWSGGVYMAAPCCDVAFESEASLGVFSSSDYGERLFCKACGSSLMFRTKDGSATVVSVQAFDDDDGLVFAEEIFVDEKPALYAFANDTRKLTGEQFFARWAQAREQPGEKPAGQEQAGG